MMSTAMTMTVLTHPFQVLFVAMVLARLMRSALASAGGSKPLGDDPAYRRGTDRVSFRWVWIPGIA